MNGDRRVVLDASALLAWVMNERGAATVDRVLAVGIAPASVLVETLYRAVEKGHRLSVGQLHAALLEMGLEVEPVTEGDVDCAAQLIAECGRHQGRASCRSATGPVSP